MRASGPTPSGRIAGGTPWRSSPPGTEGGQEAHLAFASSRGPDAHTTLELRPTTGRGHQLRVQLASRGFPILGDRKYGSTSTVRAADGGHRIALHARELTFTHPTRAAAISVTAGEPADWPA